MTTTYQISRFERTERSDRTLALGFAVSIGIHLLLIGIYAIVATGGTTGREPLGNDPGSMRNFRIELSRIAQRAGSNQAPGKGRGGSGTAGGAHGGIRSAGFLPVPSNDSAVADLFPIGGPIPDVIGGDPMPISTPIGESHVIEKPVEREIIPAPDEDIFDGVEPQIDLALLQSHVVYPEIARAHGIDGQVVVRVLIDAKGKATTMKIQYSDSKLLEVAAMDAIRRTQFTPGIRNRTPVPVWMVIPVRFQLR